MATAPFLHPPLNNLTIARLGETMNGEFPEFKNAMKFEVKLQGKKLQAIHERQPVNLTGNDKIKLKSRKNTLKMFAMTAKLFSMADHPASATPSVEDGVANPVLKTDVTIGKPTNEPFIDFRTLSVEEQIEKVANFRNLRIIQKLIATNSRNNL